VDLVLISYKSAAHSTPNLDTKTLPLSSCQHHTKAPSLRASRATTIKPTKNVEADSILLFTNKIAEKNGLSIERRSSHARADATSRIPYRDEKRETERSGRELASAEKHHQKSETEISNEGDVAEQDSIQQRRRWFILWTTNALYFFRLRVRVRLEVLAKRRRGGVEEERKGGREEEKEEETAVADES
jgi:hypothetical protein